MSSDQTRYFLSEEQHKIQMLRQKDTVLFVRGVLLSDGHVDHQRLEKAINAVVESHEILRTQIVHDEGLNLPMQQVVDRTIIVNTRDWRGYAEKDWNTHLDDLLKKQDQANLANEGLMVDLIQVVKGRYLIVFIFSPLFIDNATLTDFLQMVAEAYEQGQLGAEEVVQYADFSKWQNEFVSSEDYLNGSAFWAQAKQEHAPMPFAAEINNHARELTTESWNLDASETKALRNLEAPLADVVQATFALLLNRFSASSTRTIYRFNDGRIFEQLEGALGNFGRYLPQSHHFHDDDNFSAFLEELSSSIGEAGEHFVFYSWDKHGNLTDENSYKRAIYNYHNGLCHRFGDGHRWTLVSLDQLDEPFSIMLTALMVDDSLRLQLSYFRDQLDPRHAVYVLRRFRWLLTNVAENPTVNLPLLDTLGPHERHRILDIFNETQSKEGLREICLHELLSEQAAQHPERAALESAGRRLTFQQLDEQTNQLAQRLLQAGAGSLPVGLCMTRSVDMIVGLFAILKAGVPYIPIDPEVPVARLTYILEETASQLVVTQSALTGLFANFKGTVVVPEQESLEAYPKGAPSVPVTPHHPAYILFTSGSTGHPKGVIIPHYAAANLAYALQERIYQHHPKPSLIGLNASIAFDSSVKQIIQICNGHTLHVVPDGIRMDGSALAQYLDKHNIDFMDCTPTQFKLLRTSGLFADKSATLNLLLGGEDVDRETWNQLASRAHTRSFNLYGPTECTVNACVAHIDQPGGVPNIGKPLANVQVYILDKTLAPVPEGVEGQVFIGGRGLARGYVGRFGLTAASFIPNPFSRHEGARLYCTGDMARYLADGSVAYNNRADFQVKIRGIRIELGEIENTLAAHEAVNAAVVLLREDTPGDKRLVAYVTAVPGCETDETLLRTYLHDRLPDYMVPYRVITMDRLPMGRTGKVDRHALPEPETFNRKANANYVAPKNQLEKDVASVWAEVLQTDKIGLEDNFFEIGGHSLLLMQVQEKLKSKLGYDVAMVELFRQPTVGATVRYLKETLTVPEADGEVVARMDRGEGFAIVGMSCRFPGAPNVDAFLDNLSNGVNSITHYSREELLATGLDEGLLNHPNYVMANAMLDDVTTWDAAFFGMNPGVAQITDPQQRLFLECAWEALESTGYSPDSHKDDIAVFGGMSINTFLLENYEHNRDVLESVGIMQAAMANRNDHIAMLTSYKLNLKGPAITVQTACSTTLTAVHMACRQLAEGRVRMALAGGVSVRVPQMMGYLHQEGGVASPDGVCRAFDAKGQGTIFGSGVGVVALKRLEDAKADGDTIHAVIKGSAINNDGSDKIGYTAPSANGQRRVIRAAILDANVSPETIGYVEAHGTATPLGDLIEVDALTRAFRQSTDAKNFCGLGSVKTNVGHLDAAAGAAGLIKTVLSLKHKKMFASLNFEEPNPNIDFAGSPFFVNTETRHWERNANFPRRAGVSAFGIGGTNVHLILEEAPEAELFAPQKGAVVLPLSARSAPALEAMCERLQGYLTKNPEINLADVAYTLQTGRRLFDFRRILVCHDVADAVGNLEHLYHGRAFSAAKSKPNPAISFMFSGLGTQYPGMFSGLYSQSVQYHDLLEDLIQRYERAGGPNLEALFSSEQNTDGAEAAHLAEPALFLGQYALAQLWMSWGIEPARMIGQGVGSWVAACLNGVFSLDEAMTLLLARARITANGSNQGLMLVNDEEGTIRDSVENYNDLFVLDVLRPTLCLVGGLKSSCKAYAEVLEKGIISYRHLPCNWAWGTPREGMELEPLATAFAKIQLNVPNKPIVCSQTGTWLEETQATSSEYWLQTLTSEANFSAGLGILFEDPDTLLLEIGPSRTLFNGARLHPKRPVGQPMLPSLHMAESVSQELTYLMTTLGRLWTYAATINWEAVNGGQRRKRLPLPTYPFERKRLWLDTTHKKDKNAGLPTRRANLEDWFYAPDWRRSIAPMRGENSRIKVTGRPAHILFFCDQSDLSLFVGKELADQGCQVTFVRPSTGFAEQSRSNYHLDPSDPEQYRKLLRDLKEGGQMPDLVLHGWSATPRHAFVSRVEMTNICLDHGFYSLLFLASALGESKWDQPIQLDVWTSQLFSITGSESVVPEKAPLLGLLRSLRDEQPNLVPRCIDLAAELMEHPQNLRRAAANLINEVCYGDNQLMIAYRNGRRWLLEYQPLKLAETKQENLPIKQEGVYLITGGMGGMGLTFAQYLASSYKARLILVSRSPLPPREQWTGYLATAAPNDDLAAKVRAIGAMEAAGAQVLVVSANVADRAQMQEVARQAQARFGKVNGVIHSAGVPTGGLMAGKTKAMAQEVLAPKIQGTLILDELFGNSLDFMVLCSSRTAVLGGMGQSDYAAANTFLDSFAHYKNEAGSRTVSLNWCGWSDVGMLAAASKTTTRAGGVANKGERILRSRNFGHHLLHRQVVYEGGKEHFYTDFAPETHWILNDHRILGRPVIPGTGYLEMIRATLQERADAAGKSIEITDVFFLAPFIVDDSEVKVGRLVLKETPEGFAFEMFSRDAAAPDEEHAYMKHVMAKARLVAPPADNHRDMFAILARLTRDTKLMSDVDAWDEDHGQRWQAVKKVHWGQDEVLAIIETPIQFTHDLDMHHIHPAVLDKAIGTGRDFIIQQIEFMPYSYGRVVYNKPFPRRIFVHNRAKSKDAHTSQTPTFDLTLMDEKGDVLLDITTFSIKRIEDIGAIFKNLSLTGATATSGADLSYSRGSLDDSRARMLAEESITSKEGVEVLLRALAVPDMEQIVVSKSDMNEVLAHLGRQRGIAPAPDKKVKNLTAKVRQPRPQLAVAYTAPDGDVETQLAEIWGKVLGLDRVGAYDNFLDLGGDSLLAVQVISETNETLGGDIPVAHLFESPTVRQFSELVGPINTDKKKKEEVESDAFDRGAQRRARIKNKRGLD